MRGAIVYTVSDEASDKMAADLANSENQSDALAGIDVDRQDSDQVKDILFDLTRRETRNFGVVFAQNLVKHLGTATRMFKIPHQQASFKVLEAPDVPSALIELGYRDQPRRREAAYLGRLAGQRRRHDDRGDRRLFRQRDRGQPKAVAAICC